MKKNSKTVLIVCIVFVAIALAAVIYFAVRKSKETVSIDTKDNTLKGGSTAPAIPINELKFGSKGDSVRTLQSKLNSVLTAKHPNGVTATSSTTGKTTENVKSLKVDGDFGALTEGVLIALTGKNSIALSAVSGLA